MQALAVAGSGADSLRQVTQRGVSGSAGRAVVRGLKITQSGLGG